MSLVDKKIVDKLPNEALVFNPELYDIILGVPKKHVAGVIDPEHATPFVFYVNGKEMFVRPPFKLVIDEKNTTKVTMHL